MAGERRWKATWGSHQGKESGVGPAWRVSAVKPLGGRRVPEVPRWKATRGRHEIRKSVSGPGLRDRPVKHLERSE